MYPRRFSYISQMTDFKEQFEQRLILLRSGACCAIIKQPDSSKLYLVLSSSGAFVQIHFQGNQFKHLTRFVPSRFEESVKKLLDFRNEFAAEPFLCKRFQSKQQDQARYPVVPSRIEIPASTVGDSKLFVCPLSRRISVLTEHVISADDNCIEYPIRGVEIANSYSTSNMCIYPVSRLPAALRSAILSPDSAMHGSSLLSMRPVGGAARSSVAVDSLAETTDLLASLMVHLSVLATDRDKYPVGVCASKQDQTGGIDELETLVMAECLDDDVYLVSNDPFGAHTAHGQVVHQKLKELVQRAKDSSSGPTGSNVITTQRTQMSTGCAIPNAGQLEVEVWIHPSDDHPAGIIIHLRGDYFTFHCESDGEPFQKSFHYSFLQYELHRRAQVLELGHEDLTLCHDLDAPEETTSSGENREHGEHTYHVSMLLRRYYKQALKLVRYRDYLAEQAQRCGEQAFRQALCIPDVHSVEMSSRSRLQSNTTGLLPPSCSTVSLACEDGSNFSAVLKCCHTVAEAAPYNLIISQVPSSVHATVPLVNSPPKPRIYPCDCVTQISATFPDHSMVKFDLASQMFTLLFATGKECSFSLGSYKRQEGIFACQAYIPQIDDTFHQNANALSLPVHGINVRYPSADEVNVPHISSLVRRVLAFHRWADTPAELRPALEEHDRRTAIVARAATLQASRHLLLSRVAQGQLSAQEALRRSSQFDARMQNLAEPSPSTPPTCQQATGRRTVTHALEQHEVSTKSSPSPFACITPSPAIGRRVMVVSDGSTIATGSAASERSSSLTYSQLSSVPGSSLSSPPAAPRYVATVSPESARSELNYVSRVADKVAGAYLYKNISIHPTKNSFGKPDVPVVSPDKTSRFHEVMSRNKKTCDNLQFNVEIPRSRIAMPDYQPPLNGTTAKCLSATYVQSAVDDSMRQAAKNAEYLKQYNLIV